MPALSYSVLCQPAPSPELEAAARQDVDRRSLLCEERRMTKVVVVDVDYRRAGSSWPRPRPSSRAAGPHRICVVVGDEKRGEPLRPRAIRAYSVHCGPGISSVNTTPKRNGLTIFGSRHVGLPGRRKAVRVGELRRPRLTKCRHPLRQARAGWGYRERRTRPLHPGSPSTLGIRARACANVRRTSSPRSIPNSSLKTPKPAKSMNATSIEAALSPGMGVEESLKVRQK